MKRALPLILAIATVLVLIAAPSAGAAVTSISAEVTQDAQTPTSASVSWSLSQDDIPFGGNNAMVFATSPAWAGCNGVWPYGSPWYANEVSVQHFALHNAGESGVDQVTLPAGRSMCVGVVAQDQYGAITYDATYVNFDQPSGYDTGNGSSYVNSLVPELSVTPNGLPTYYSLSYFEKTQPGDCMTLAFEQSQFSSTDPELISDDLYAEHVVYPEITGLQPERSYCIAARINNAQGNADGNYWGYTTASPPPTIDSESYSGNYGQIDFNVSLTPNATLSDSSLNFQYFKKVGSACTLVVGEEQYSYNHYFTPNRVDHSVPATGSITGLDPHAYYCVRAFSVNLGGGSNPGDFTTVRTVNQLAVGTKYAYFQPPTDNPYDIGLAIGFDDYGASEDLSELNTVSLRNYRVSGAECNSSGVAGETPTEELVGAQFAGDADYDFDISAGARGTENCVHAHVDSAWGHAFDYDHYFPFKSGAKPAISGFSETHTSDSITVGSLVDPGEFSTNISLFHAPLGDAAQCSEVSPQIDALDPISSSLSTPQTISTTLSGLDDYTTYCFLFMSGNTLGQGAGTWQQVTTDDATAPDKPTGLQVSGVTQTSATLAWDAPSDNAGVTGYNIYKSGQLLATKESPSIALDGLCGKTDHLRVSAVDAAENESAQSDEFAVTYAACDVPPAPAKTCLAPVKNKSVTLKNKKKRVKATVKTKLSADRQGMTITAAAKGAKISFKVDGKSTKATKGSIKITNNPSLVTVSFKLAGKTTTVKVKLGKYSC